MCVHVSVLLHPSPHHKSANPVSNICHVSSSYSMLSVGATVTHQNFLHRFGHATSHNLVFVTVISYTSFALCSTNQTKLNRTKQVPFLCIHQTTPPFKSQPLSTLMHPPTYHFGSTQHNLS